MAGPRWQKVRRELWHHRARTLLVVLSIAVGALAVGAVAGTYAVIRRELPAAYAQVNPASFRLGLEPFDAELLRVVRAMPEVAAAEARRTVPMRLEVGPDQWRDIQVFALPDYRSIAVGKVWPQAGSWPPGFKELLLERAAAALIGAQVGDEVVIETPLGTQRTVRVAGLVHDMNQPSPRFVNTLYGYVSPATLQWLGVEGDFNELSVVAAGDRLDPAHVRQVANTVRSKVERSGRRVFWTVIPEPGKHPFERFLGPMAILLGALGLLSLLLSGFLVVNTISALLAQELRQIGVMKAVGARSAQVRNLYLVYVAALGGLALLVALPASLLVTRGLVHFLARLVNFDVLNPTPPPGVFALQVVAGLAVPLAAALAPVRRGARLTVREAMVSYGISAAAVGSGRLDRLVLRVRGLPRPVLLSLRNTFRRRLRLALTLATLALASTIVVSVGSVRASLLATLDDALRYWQYDIAVSFARPYRVEEIQRLAQAVPGVVNAESWGFQSVRRLRPDQTVSDPIALVAPPADTTMLRPTVLAGRWLLPEDQNALVLTTDLLREEPDLRVGQTVELQIGERITSWVVVGIIRGVLSGPTAYANYPYASRVTRLPDRAGSVQVVSERHDPAYLRSLAAALEAHFEANSLRVTSASTVYSLRRTVVAQFNVIVLLLLAMALLLALVGALGLTGTMSINVLERTKEIGVMRAIGAKGRTVRQMVVLEGVLIAALSWMVGAALAVPISRVLSRAVGIAFLQAPLTYTFSVAAAAVWLVAVTLLAALASLWPARSASRLSVRDVLAYE